MKRIAALLLISLLALVARDVAPWAEAEALHAATPAGNNFTFLPLNRSLSARAEATGAPS